MVILQMHLPVNHDLTTYWSSGGDFDLHSHIISHGQQNLNKSYKVKDQGRSATGFRIKAYDQCSTHQMTFSTMLVALYLFFHVTNTEGNRVRGEIVHHTLNYDNLHNNMTQLVQNLISTKHENMNIDLFILGTE